MSSTAPPNQRRHRRRLDPERRHARGRAAGRDPACLGGGWSPTVPVGDPTVNSEAPQVIVDASADAVATWIAGKVLLAATRPAAGTWSPADEVSDPARGLGVRHLRPDRHPRRARGGGLVDCRHHRRPGHPGPRFVLADGVFGDPVTISSGDTTAISPRWRSTPPACAPGDASGEPPPPTTATSRRRPDGGRHVVISRGRVRRRRVTTPPRTSSSTAQGPPPWCGAGRRPVSSRTSTTPATRRWDLVRGAGPHAP